MPPATAAKKPSSTKVGKRVIAGKPEVVDDLDEWKKSKQLLKPKDQLELTDAELKEPIVKQLMTTNTRLPDSLIEFSYAVGSFVQVPSPGNLVVAYKSEGTLLLRDSEEARQQMIEMGLDPDTYEESTAILATVALPPVPEVSSVDEDTMTIVTVIEDEQKEGEAEEGEPKPEKHEEEHEEEEEKAQAAKVQEQKPPPKTGGRPRKLTNQFNFSERAALTYNLPTRSQETQTIPPPMATFSANVLQWIIYDAYLEDFAAQEREKELERERRERDKAPTGKFSMAKKASGKGSANAAFQARLFESWKVLERMINQNTYNDIAKDYRYWDDPSDEYRDDQGTLLPLWKFTLDKVKKHTVTDIEWNPYYYDLFAACFGFLEFTKPIDVGAVCLFTLKNPSYPDYICMTESAAMCVDTHPKYPYMIVIGLYDGSVEVFNIQNTCKTPAFRSNNVLNKHRGIVWEVKWAPDMPDGELNFFSVSADGKINNWVLMQNDLAVTTIITLFLAKDPVPGPDGTLLKVKGSATCVKLHPKKPLIYLVGTEEGLIYKCSTAYSSSYLLTYKAHQMPVYRIDFNRYNTDIFVSCSGDWRIKIWEDNRLEPLFVFDVGDRVGDVKWAPYSSTVFAAVTSVGKVFVFDINVNKYKPICIQAVVSRKRNKLTRLTFNWNLPIIIVGDDKGCITTLKLSPNLRIPCKAPKKQQHLDQWTLQCMKLDKLLALVREPVTLSLPQDTAGTEQ